MSSKLTDEWYTPDTDDQPCIRLVQSVLGLINLDPCSPVGSQAVSAVSHFTIEDDCLNQDWWGTVYMNPPFSNPFPFLRRLCYFYELGQVPEAIACLKAGTQANKGTGGLIMKHASAVCQWGAGKASRIAFVGKDGKPKKGADFDCIFVYFGKNWRLFDYYFRQYGHVMPTQRTIDLLLGVNNLPITEVKL